MDVEEKVEKIPGSWVLGPVALSDGYARNIIKWVMRTVTMVPMMMVTMVLVMITGNDDNGEDVMMMKKMMVVMMVPLIVGGK